MILTPPDPRAPFHRKQAADPGDAGVGSCANNLSLGCDCLGSSCLSDGQGDSVAALNVICLHEQDGSIDWKHTHRLNHTASVVRAKLYPAIYRHGR